MGKRLVRLDIWIISIVKGINKKLSNYLFFNSIISYEEFQKYFTLYMIDLFQIIDYNFI